VAAYSATTQSRNVFSLRLRVGCRIEAHGLGYLFRRRLSSVFLHEAPLRPEDLNHSLFVLNRSVFLLYPANSPACAPFPSANSEWLRMAPGGAILQPAEATNGCRRAVTFTNRSPRFTSLKLCISRQFDYLRHARQAGFVVRHDRCFLEPTEEIGNEDGDSGLAAEGFAGF